MTRRPTSSSLCSEKRAQPGPTNIDHYYSPSDSEANCFLRYAAWPEARTSAALARLATRCERILHLTRKERTNLTQKDFIEPQRDLAVRQYYGLSTRGLSRERETE